ncbi:MAG TPA: MBL fold metallo-hydrolase [Acidobacteriaceae bacterium]|nr:MBL fold metallo-hydrolase [Acidobacteriaceae bacterium]
MHTISIPADQVVPIDQVAPNLHGLRIAFVNVFGVGHSDGSWTLIDAGIPFSASLIRKWSEKQFSAPPRAIVLTHGHFDHVSAAGELADTWQVPVYAHALELPYLCGEQEYAAPNFTAGGGLMSLLSPLYPRGPVNLGTRLRRLPATEFDPSTLPELPGWEILHTPGHTPGHVSFFRRQDKTLLVGDAFCTTRPESFFDAAVVQQPELHGPPSYFTSDWSAARQSVQLLAGLDPAIIAPGHGRPLAGETVADALRKLAKDFEAIAIPANQRGREA